MINVAQLQLRQTCLTRTRLLLLYPHSNTDILCICSFVNEYENIETAVKLYYDKLPHFNGCVYSTKYRMVSYEFDNTLEVSTNFWTSQSGFWLVHSEERSHAVSIYRASQYISLCMTSIRVAHYFPLHSLQLVSRRTKWCNPYSTRCYQ